MNKKSILYNTSIISIFVCLTVSAAFAQTTAFTYQGKLTDTGTQSATYDFEFNLCDGAATDCSLPLETQQIANVTVSSGVFTVTLDFAAAAFNGEDRWLEIKVKRPAQANFTTLAPRQPMTSAPYSIKSLLSFDAENLGGIAAENYLQFDGDGANLTNVAKLNADNVFNGSDNSFPQITLSGDGQIIAPRLENSAADPAPAAASNAGRIYFSTTDNTVKVSNGAAWVSLSPSQRQLSVFTANTTFAAITCGSNIRSISFNKVSAASRLRITYKDEFTVLSGASFSAFRVEVRIDGATTSPVSMTNQFSTSCSGGLCSGGEDETIVGYADGIAAGSHTFTSVYTGFLFGSPTCYRPAKYLVEIEEIP